MLVWPGTPTTDVTRPPPTAGPKLRNLMFSKMSCVFLSDVDEVSAEEDSEVCAIRIPLNLAPRTNMIPKVNLIILVNILIFLRVYKLIGPSGDRGIEPLKDEIRKTKFETGKTRPI